jgi:hypothetical protein
LAGDEISAANRSQKRVHHRVTEALRKQKPKSKPEDAEVAEDAETPNLKKYYWPQINTDKTTLFLNLCSSVAKSSSFVFVRNSRRAR